MQGKISHLLTIVIAQTLAVENFGTFTVYDHSAKVLSTNNLYVNCFAAQSRQSANLFNYIAVCQSFLPPKFCTLYSIIFVTQKALMTMNNVFYRQK